MIDWPRTIFNCLAAYVAAIAVGIGAFYVILWAVGETVEHFTQ